ncbi:MAG: nickel ABC transporter permease [Eubacteriaceae bacterium]|jgi:peptide/nickel transport system permease protein
MNRKQLGKRLLQMLIVLLGISFITYALIYLAPGDPVRIMFAASGTVPSEEILQETRVSLGLDKTFFVQYGTWLLHVLQGNLGTSFSMNKPVATILLQRLGPTLLLAFTSMILMLVVSVPLGMWAAVKQNRFPDYMVRGLSFFGISIPNFWLGLILLYVFALKLGWFPVVSSKITFSSLVLPSVTLAVAMSAKYTRQVRTAVLEELNQDYVTGARARGIPEKTILWKHVFPNSALPLITLLGLSLGSLLGGTAVIEVIFNYPGLGNLVVSAVTAYDYPLIQGYVLWIALIYMIINLVVDLSYERLDPRIREAV